ncbi:hypothetical protein GG344DRAFT_60772, partial [Lentinula edodes]
DEHLQQARTLLETWCNDTFNMYYRRASWPAETLLPSTVLTSIATKACFCSLEDLISAGWSKIFTSKHGNEVLQLLKSLDVQHYAKVDKQRAQIAEAKRQATREKLAE